MTTIEQRISSNLTEEGGLPHAMFQTYLPAIESYFSGLHLNFVSPEEDHPILGGRAMEGDLQGLIIAIEKSKFGEEISTKSIIDIDNHVNDFLTHANEQKEYTTVSGGLSDLFGQFRLKSKSGIDLMSQTTVLIISQGKLNVDEFNRNDYHLPIEVIDLNIAEQSYDLSEETVKNTNEGVFSFNPSKHERPKVFSDPAPHQSHAIHMGHITGLALSDMFRYFGRKMIEVNVRDFLGDTSINKGMRSTIKDEPERFAAYNNGLTIVCSQVEIENNEIVSITNPSVVNGGQTTMVIVDESRKGTPVHQVRVPIRIVEIKSEHAADKLQFPSLISRYANMQNNIKTTDQLVNESPHPELNKYCDENVAELDGWYYAHRRGMVKTRALEMGDDFEKWIEKHPETKRVEAIDASTMWAAWIGEPAAASLGSQRCFTFYHGYVTTENAKQRLKYNHFLKQTFALKIIRDKLKVISQVTKQTTMFSATLPHTLGWFSHLTEHKFDLIDIFNNGEVDGETGYILRVLFDHVNQYLRKIEDELPSEHAKRKECTDTIRTIQLDEKVLSKLQKLPLTTGRPLKGEPLGSFLMRIGQTKLYDAFNFIKYEHSDGNTGGLGSDFGRAMKFGFNKKGADTEARDVIKIMRVWNLANQLGYSDEYPGEYDLYMRKK